MLDKLIHILDYLPGLGERREQVSLALILLGRLVTYLDGQEFRAPKIPVLPGSFIWLF